MYVAGPDLTLLNPTLSTSVHSCTSHIPRGGRPDSDIEEGLEGPLLLVHLVHVVRASVRLARDHLKLNKKKNKNKTTQPESA